MTAIPYVPFLVGAVAVDGNITSGFATARTIKAPIANFRDASTMPDKQLLRCEMPMRASVRTQLEHDAFVESTRSRLPTTSSLFFPAVEARSQRYESGVEDTIGTFRFRA